MMLKQKRIFLLPLVLLGLFLFIGLTITSGTKKVSAANEDFTNLVVDDGNIFTDAERSKLAAKCKEASSADTAAIYIYTFDKMINDSASIREMESFARQSGRSNLVILGINIATRFVEIQGYGYGETYIPTNRINKTLDAMMNSLHDNQFYDASITYINKTEYFLSRPARLDSIFFQSWFRLVVSLAAGVIITLILLLRVDAKMTATSNSYFDFTNSRLLANRERYVRTSVTKVRKPSSNSSGGRSGGGGGMSHSGSGGRHF